MRRASQGAYWALLLIPQAMQSLKTYIVEDSQVIRDSLIAMLEELAAVSVVGTAETEVEAVRWLAHADHSIDLLILDIFLKTGSGLGVLRAAQKIDYQHNVVVLSNFATPDIRRRCLALGADRVFDKSNEIDDLISYCNALAHSDKTGGASTPLP